MQPQCGFFQDMPLAFFSWFPRAKPAAPFAPVQSCCPLSIFGLGATERPHGHLNLKASIIKHMFRNITFTVYDVKICEDSLSNKSRNGNCRLPPKKSLLDDRLSGAQEVYNKFLVNSKTFQKVTAARRSPRWAFGWRCWRCCPLRLLTARRAPPKQAAGKD